MLEAPATTSSIAGSSNPEHTVTTAHFIAFSFPYHDEVVL
jgi:hypothetical protein